MSIIHLMTTGQIQSAMGAQGYAARLNRRSAAIMWVIASLAYAVLRISMADRFLKKYGLNTFWFAIIELLATVVFSVASARFVGAVLDRRSKQTFGWLGLTLAGFLAADVYTILVTNQLPDNITFLMFFAISLGIVGTVVGLFFQLRDTGHQLAGHELAGHELAGHDLANAHSYEVPQ